MSSISSGMNIDAVEGIARDLHNQACAIGTVLSHVDRLVNQSQQDWKGKDATDFEGWWTGQHRPHLVQLQQQLDGLGTSAHNNARDQRDVSGR